MAHLPLKSIVGALLLLATPALAHDYRYSSPHYGNSYRRYYAPPRRERTTITRQGNRTVIETRRYYGPLKGGKLATPRGRFSGAFRGR